MDPHNDFASVTAVVQIASQIREALKTYYYGCREAREDISRLFDATDSLDSLLKQAQAIPSSTSISASEPSAAGYSRNPSGPVELLHLELDRLNKVLEAPKLSGEAGRLSQNLKWLLQKNDVDKIVRIIEHHKSSFSPELGLGAL